MRYINLIILLFFLFAHAYATEDETQPCISLPGPVNPIFTSAYKIDGSFVFSPIFEIDWQGIAPSRVTLSNIENPTQADMDLLMEHRYYESYSALPYNVQLDCSTYIGNYFLISETGVNPVKLSTMKGRAKYTIIGGKIHDQPRYTGNIEFFPPSVEATEGGFIMLSGEKINEGRPFRMDSNPDFSAVAKEEKMTYTYRTSNKELKLTHNWDSELGHPVGIKSQYSFSINGSNYIYVRWEANPNYCSFYATLFKAFKYGDNPSLEKLATTRYGCGWL